MTDYKALNEQVHDILFNGLMYKDNGNTLTDIKKKVTIKATQKDIRISYAIESYNIAKWYLTYIKGYQGTEKRTNFITLKCCGLIRQMDIGFSDLDRIIANERIYD